MSRPLLQDDGSGRIHAELAQLAQWGPREAGPVRATFGPRTSWALILPWLVVGVVLLGAAYPVNPDFFPVSALVLLVIFGGGALAAWLWTRAQRTRVAEHALVLGSAKKVVPYATIDPGRVAVSSAVSGLGRHFHSGGVRILQSRGSVAVINGLNPDPSATSPHLPPSSVPSPFCEWGLSGEPAEVLAALEQAMRDAGYPATGMTELARSRTFAPPKTHPATDVLLQRRALDPPVGVPG